MKEIFQRLIFLFHWVGFICLALLILLGVFGILTGDGESFFGAVFRILLFQPLGGFAGSFHILLVWLAVIHYPIKWILTGNKSPFPWKS